MGHVFFTGSSITRFSHAIYFFFLGFLPLQGHNKRHKCIVCLHLPIMSSLWTLLSFCSLSLVVNPVPCITILPWCWKQRRSFVCHFPCFLIHTYVPSTRLLHYRKKELNQSWFQESNKFETLLATYLNLFVLLLGIFFFSFFLFSFFEGEGLRVFGADGCMPTLLCNCASIWICLQFKSSFLAYLVKKMYSD